MKKIAADRNYNNLKKTAGPSEEPWGGSHPDPGNSTIQAEKAEYLRANNNNLEAAFEMAIRHAVNGTDNAARFSKLLSECGEELRKCQGLPPWDGKPQLAN